MCAICSSEHPQKDWKDMSYYVLENSEIDEEGFFDTNPSLAGAFTRLGF